MRKLTFIFTLLLLPFSIIFAQHGNRIEANQTDSPALDLSEKSKLLDSDGDLISDDIDKCPGMKGAEENFGCPEISKEVKLLFDKTLSDITFPSGTDSLTNNSKKALDRITNLMNANEGYILKVSGYADSLGTVKENEELSHNRAVAVKKYLTREGVPTKRIRIASFGEKLPKVETDSISGSIKNRRVEFELFYH